MKSKKMKVAVGGVTKESLDKEGIIPVIFSRESFNDASLQLNQLDKLIRKDEISEFIIMLKRKDGSIKYIWRGENPLTSILGTISFVKMLIQRDFIE